MKAPLSQIVRDILFDPDKSKQFMKAVITNAKTDYKNPITIGNKEYILSRVKNRRG